MLLGSNTQECQIILWIDIAHDTSRLLRQLMQQASVLHRCRVIECRLNGYTVRVDDDQADDALVRRYAFNRLFDFRLEIERVIATRKWKISFQEMTYR